MTPNSSSRRKFLQAAGLSAAGAGLAAPGSGVSIVIDPADPIGSSGPAQWAAGELQVALEQRGLAVQRCAHLADAGAASFCITVAGAQAALARAVLNEARVPIPSLPEALVLASGSTSGRSVVAACGTDVRGAVFAVLELADRARYSSNPVEALAVSTPVAERPANQVRSVTRLFTSDVEDKPWFNDRTMWGPYLTMLAGQRFNRFHLALGIGYDFLRKVTDAYFLFAYPFLLDVPGYRVHVPQLPVRERDSNLEMLRYISEQTVARGMEFQLGLWMHGYEWIDSPNPNYTIEGLTHETHGPYCRDAVRALLKACPAISGVTFRVHGESGVDEGSYQFWKTVFEGVSTCGRTVEIDMHSKGMDQTMLDIAVGSGMPVKLSPKYWGEHLGMPYHQADIRELERPKPNAQTSRLMKLSAGSRSFLRYGYGDLLREDRKWDVVHRIWPGTQRLLLWGDPVTAAAYARAFRFCGSAGVEIMEPLSFKGRRGSGLPGGRCAYADTSLNPRWDWEKYVYSHRIWGRLLYNPDSSPEVWQRYLKAQFGAGSAAMESALAHGSRILPIVTTAHAASAGNNTYWPEVYLNQSLVDATQPGPYTDSPAPRVFGNVSPLDPQLFYRIKDYADDLLKGEVSGQYSPVEVAQWIEDFAAEAAKSAAQAQALSSGKDRPEYRRAAIDVDLMVGLGRFFGAKFRAGVLYRIFEQTGDRIALEQCLRMYRAARAAFATVAERGKGVYVPDITVGELRQLRGHWMDRLPAMDADISEVARKLEGARPAEGSPLLAQAIAQATGRPRRDLALCIHTPGAVFRAGEPLEIALTSAAPMSSVQIYFRHVNQAERWVSAAMEVRESVWRAAIPADYTNSQYWLQYYFEVRRMGRSAALYPGLGAELNQQPYFTVKRGAETSRTK
ncbi:twin-arginine translocation signal domain-containing protein [Paludibaculum fermentans]|uniref:Twin-arginine translocation signal domain-containing protein n=1 Tax=Paludibaculum fermentans TaxID=1473598 RepID=A0A7S7SMR3_PALFE|nr:twin-arginine translocation signal domain-containing protein [Paludibaculum fermentans]QOY90218.1 twin-arginine translocation signal domain-containing protein [Paludibaculum fermentans]